MQSKDIETKCTACLNNFRISNTELSFLQKVAPTFNSKSFTVSTPRLCPDCRAQQRYAHRNERCLYKRKCDHCSCSMVTIYSPDKDFKVYCPDCWWSDAWDPLSYGQVYDFTQSFFTQFQKLLKAVPKLGLFQFDENINSEYNHDVQRLKNCYLIFDGEQAVDSYYGETFCLIKDCLDFLKLQQCELCYECINCSNCYNLKYSDFCQNCSDSFFLLDCIGCRNCFACSNLKQKEFCFYNEQLSEVEYRKRIESLQLGDRKEVESLRYKIDSFFSKLPRRAYRGHQNENVRGDNLNNSKNSFECYDCCDLRDCNHCTNLLQSANDCFDIDLWGNAVSFCYNSVAVGEGALNVISSYYACFGVRNIFYSSLCTRNSSNLFGCAGLRQKSYCILNKSLTKDDYERTAQHIAEELSRQNIWGEFIPAELSDFGYNETVAMQYFPLGKEKAIGSGYNWSEYSSANPVSNKMIKACDLPSKISDLDDSTAELTVVCEKSQKLFRITQAELQFYKKNNIPLPILNPDERHLKRLQRRNPRKNYERSCSKCGKRISSTYPPSHNSAVYCVECYAAEL